MKAIEILAFASLNILPADLPFDSVVTAAEVYPNGTVTESSPTIYLYAPGVSCWQGRTSRKHTHIAYINDVRLHVDGFTYLSRGDTWIVFGPIVCD